MSGSSFAVVITGGFGKLPVSQVNGPSAQFALQLAAARDSDHFNCACRCCKAPLALVAASTGAATPPFANCPLQLANVTLAGLVLFATYPLSNFLQAPITASPCRWPLKRGSFFGSSCHPLRPLSALHSRAWVLWATPIFTFSKASRHPSHPQSSKALNAIRAAPLPCPLQCCMSIPQATKLLCPDCGSPVSLRPAATAAQPPRRCA